MVHITIKLTEEEHKIIKEKAKKNRQSIAQYLIFCALNGIDLEEVFKNSSNKKVVLENAERGRCTSFLPYASSNSYIESLLYDY